MSIGEVIGLARAGKIAGGAVSFAAEDGSTHTVDLSERPPFPEGIAVSGEIPASVPVGGAVAHLWPIVACISGLNPEAKPI